MVCERPPPGRSAPGLSPFVSRFVQIPGSEGRESKDWCGSEASHPLRCMVSLGFHNQGWLAIRSLTPGYDCTERSHPARGAQLTWIAVLRKRIAWSEATGRGSLTRPQRGPISDLESRT